MSGLFGGGGMSTSDTPLTGMTIQSSSNGKPIPIVYGTTRVTPNLLWYGDFTPIEHTTSQGGKGGGSSSTTHTYTASLILGLCEGPVAGIPNAFIDKSVVDPSTLFSLFLGTYPQSPWSYLTSSHADQAIGYQGITYAAAASYDLGNSSNLPNHSFEVSGKLILSGTSDADPSQVVSDLLTSQIYGVPNAPPISGLTQYSNYCRAAGILISPCYDTQTAAAQMITDLAQITNTGIYVSEGVLKLVPYGDAALTLNGATYTPVLTVIANLGDDDFLGNSGADPVIVKRNAIAATVSTTADAYNQVTVEYLDRANSYNVSTVVVQDQAAIDVYGLRPMSNITAHQIANAAAANVVAMLILQRAVYVRSQYSFRLGWQWCYLEPTDLVTLTDSALGLNLYPVRILSVDEDEFGTLTVLAEDAPPGVSSHVVANVPINGGYNVNQAIVPGDTNTPAIFEAPNALTAPDLQLWIAASGGTQWGGCEVWASSDGSTYRQIGTITSPARHGVLTASLVAGTDPDTTHALAVDLTASRGQLLAGTNADADVGNTMLWVDGELISYSAATLTSAYHYSLGSYLRRGQKGTANATHANGAQFARLDDVIFKYTVPIDRIGSPIYLKFPAFNVWGESKQSLASVAAYTHTFAGNKPNPLTGLTAVGGMFEITLNWTFTASQIDRDFIEVWGATTNNRASAYLLSSVKSPAVAWAHPGLQPGQTWYYWARVVDTSGNFSDWYPASTTGGVAAAPSADPSALLTQLKNSLGLGQLVDELATPIGLIDGLAEDMALQILHGTFSSSVAGTKLSSEALLRGTAITETQQLVTTGDAQLAQLITTLTAVVNGSVSAIQTEQTARSTADSAEATSRLALATLVAGNTAAIQTEQTARSTADSALATATTQVQARLNTGDYAAVKTESSANASALGTLNAKYSVKVDANNHVTGFELNSDGTVGSFVILADKFLICKPDGTGTPKAVLSLGTVNGTTALGLDGSLIIDGSISARSINAEGLTVSNGISPAVGAAGTGSMTGYGAVFNSNGTFAIGTPANNIVYDMTGGITINGQLIANANIVSKSATEFLSTWQWIANGAWATYTFTMEHAGNASILLTYGFQTSNILGTFEVRAQIDGYTDYDYYTGGDDGTVTIPTFYSGLSAGTHTLYMYAQQQYAVGNHLARFTLLRSYR